MIDVFAKSLVKQIREEMVFLTDVVSMGRCASFEEYQHLCGKIQGLLRAEQLMADLAQNLEKAADE